jgi:hypothetical protein
LGQIFLPLYLSVVLFGGAIPEFLNLATTAISA